MRPPLEGARCDWGARASIKIKRPIIIIITINMASVNVSPPPQSGNPNWLAGVLHTLLEMGF